MVAIPHDWYPGEVPHNVMLADGVCIDSSYSFAAFDSELPLALVVGRGSGIYNRATLVTSGNARITVGQFTVLNETYVVCNGNIAIGDHCLLSWGVVVADGWRPGASTIEDRRRAMLNAAADPMRRFPIVGTPEPVIIEDNVWVGFDAVILPGVRLGRGCIVAAKCVVKSDVPEYSVVAGNPARVVRTLDRDDSDEARARVLADFAVAPTHPADAR